MHTNRNVSGFTGSGYNPFVGHEHSQHRGLHALYWLYRFHSVWMCEFGRKINDSHCTNITVVTFHFVIVLSLETWPFLILFDLAPTQLLNFCHDGLVKLSFTDYWPHTTLTRVPVFVILTMQCGRVSATELKQNCDICQIMYGLTESCIL